MHILLYYLPRPGSLLLLVDGATCVTDCCRVSSLYLIISALSFASCFNSSVYILWTSGRFCFTCSLNCRAMSGSPYFMNFLPNFAIVYMPLFSSIFLKSISLSLLEPFAITSFTRISNSFPPVLALKEKCISLSGPWR